MKIAEAVAIKNLMRQPLFFCGHEDNGSKSAPAPDLNSYCDNRKMKTAGREEPDLKERKENIYDKKNSTGNVTSTYRGVLPMGCR